MILPNDQITTAFRKSGKTQDTFCAEQGITIHKLRYYLYKRGARRNAKIAKRRISNIPRVPPTLPVKFISFDNPPVSSNGCMIQRQPMTIITGHFSIAEVIEFVTKTGAAIC